jgi:hypothetical protein
MCTAVTHWLGPRNPPPPPPPISPHLDSYYEGAVGQQRKTTSLCNPRSIIQKILIGISQGQYQALLGFTFKVSSYCPFNCIFKEGRRYLVEAEADGSSLVVQGVEPGDAGLYTCQVSALTPVLIQHRLTVRTRPVIQAGITFSHAVFLGNRPQGGSVE